MYKVLVVDDDPNILEIVEYNLKKQGFSVITAVDGIKAIDMAWKEKPNIIILDIMLPGMDGLEVCRIIRKDTLTPIILLSAKSEEVDKIVGLESGSDDYITKPFSMRELIARIRAIQRRLQVKEADKPITGMPRSTNKFFIFQCRDIKIDEACHTVFYHNKPLKLSPKEYSLLLFLAQSPGRVFDRESLLEKIWGFDYEGTNRTVDVHIRSLRQKIETNPRSPKYLITVHGYGYKFDT